MAKTPKTWSKEEIIALMNKTYADEALEATYAGQRFKVVDAIEAIFYTLDDEGLIEYTPED